MIWKIILGTFILAGGLGMYFLSDYIAEQVLAGEKQIQSAQQTVDFTGDVLSLSPYTIGVGKMVKDTGQKKIDEGKQEVNKYKLLSKKLHTAGIWVSILGTGIIILGVFTKRKK